MVKIEDLRVEVSLMPFQDLASAIEQVAAQNLRDYDTVLAQYIPHPTNRAILVGGEDRSFRIGMVFLVMTKDLMEIKDPTTGEVLDTYQMPVAEFEIIEVRPRISVCRGTRSHQIGGYPNLEPGYPAVCQLYAEPWE